MDRRWVTRGTLVAAVVILLGAAVYVFGQFRPFGDESIDRSQPAMLESVRDLSQYHAAAGEFQVVLDIENDVRWVPAALAGERTLFVAAGSVNAFVDLGTLKDDGLVVSADGKTVELRTPKAQLDKPNLHHDRSYVFSQERGLVNDLQALAGPPDLQRFYVAAEAKLTEAAKQSELLTRAEENTRVMLTGMLQSLGFQVKVITD
ncbi:Protein of unknown function [Lentzea albidocapillata subsp. violacea]|uniref:DUF4230 domain-containing protein n=1 Tax=Lentzea albidocapillata subsp. violacea TaxID=128104 RepID=A0A1G9RE82_9PSEU|nr:DUF4230 domain-containing protein [Lentzea albidocapillata]SDM21523.1 Protein of unknown function [Lentzea albidocapillata subsp. violacea]